MFVFVITVRMLNRISKSARKLCSATLSDLWALLGHRFLAVSHWVLCTVKLTVYVKPKSC